VVLPPIYGEKLEGVGRVGSEALPIPEVTTSFREESTQVKGDGARGWAKTLGEKAKKLWKRQRDPRSIASIRAEASSSREQLEEKPGTMSRIKDRVPRISLRPRVTSSTFQPASAR
jgi:hypothetical protein